MTTLTCTESNIAFTFRQNPDTHEWSCECKHDSIVFANPHVHFSPIPNKQLQIRELLTLPKQVSTSEHAIYLRIYVQLLDMHLTIELSQTIPPPQQDLCSENTHESIVATNDDYKTFIWWGFLSFISVCNVSLWLWTFLMFRQMKHDHFQSDNSYREKQLFLSGLYVFVCAYRSFLPRIDLERYCLFDTMLSSIFLGRLVATIAEISFAMQLALFLFKMGENHHHPLVQYLAICLVPTITIAQAFCWCGVVTLNHLYHAIEETIWAISGCMLCFSFVSFVFYHPHNTALVRLGVFGGVTCLFFIVFMVLVDVPMYLRRWKQGKDNGDIPILLVFTRRGLSDVWKRRVVTTNWEIWREETLWLTGYFSTAVWISVLLAHTSPP